jgi:hypothetical protein
MIRGSRSKYFDFVGENSSSLVESLVSELKLNHSPPFSFIFHRYLTNRSKKNLEMKSMTIYSARTLSNQTNLSNFPYHLQPPNLLKMTLSQSVKHLQPLPPHQLQASSIHLRIPERSKNGDDICIYKKRFSPNFEIVFHVFNLFDIM